jgi:Tfp pilus assembly PilM family ATPase
MPKYIALEWDLFEARIAVARFSGREVQIEDAFTVPVAPRESDSTFADLDVGGLLASALASRKLGGGDALVTIGRGHVELRVLTLPPAPDDELPDLVRFQAQGHFSALGDDWSLDFLPVSGRENEQRHVLAAGMSPRAIAQIQQACETAQLRPRKLILRSCAAASLLSRRGPSAGIRLIVDLPAVDADLTVLMDGAVVFMRSVRLPGDKGSDEYAEALAGEIRRTTAAAHNQLGGRRVEEVVLFGVAAKDEPLRAGLQASIGLPVQVCDPFEQLSVSPALRSRLPDPRGFAPLLGALLDEADERPHAIDFLHPRKRAEPPSRRRLVIGVAAALAAVMLILAATIVWQLAGLESDIRTLQQRSAELDPAVETAKKQVADVDAIDAWASGEVLWIDALAELSQRFPDAEAAIVSRFVAGTRRDGGGEIVLDCGADEQDTIADLENSLRDAAHRVTGSGGQFDDRDAAYPWRFKERIVLSAADPVERPAPVEAVVATDAPPAADDNNPNDAAQAPEAKP